MTRHLWTVGLAVLLLGAAAQGAAVYGPDPVDDLRQALRTSIRDSMNREELQFRRATVEKRIKALNIGDLRRALQLQEWRDEDRDEAIGAIDRPLREALAKRLVDGLRAILERGGTPAKLAAIAQVAEMGVNVRATGTKTGLARDLAPDLVAQLKSDNQAVRDAAARALGKINADPKIAAPALGALIARGTEQDRRAASDGLEWMLRTVVQLSKGKADTVAYTREDAAQIATAVVPELGRGLPDPNYRVRRHSIDGLQLAASILGDLTPDPPASQTFPPAGRKPTKDELTEIRGYREQVEQERRVLLPLARALNAQAAGLGHALSDPETDIRFLAAQALEDMGFARQRMQRKAASVPGAGSTAEPEGGAARLRSTSPIRLVSAVQDKDAEPKKPADNLTDDPLKAGLLADAPLLAARLGDPNVRVRIAALDALEPLGPDASSVVPVVARGLQDRSLFVRWAAARVLLKVGPIDTPLTVPLLARLTCDIDLDVRLASMTTLGSYGSRANAAIPDLAKAAVTGDSDQRIAAIHALQGIGKEATSAVPQLTEALSAGDERVRRAAAEALGQFGAAAKSAIPELERFLNDSDESVRKAVSDALLAITAGK